MQWCRKYLSLVPKLTWEGLGMRLGDIYFYCIATQTFSMCFNYENFVSTSYSITKIDCSIGCS